MIKLFFVVFLMLAFCISQNSQAQILDNLKKKTEEKIKSEGERRAEDKINKGVENAYDELEGENQEEKSTENESDDQKKEESRENVNESPTKQTKTNIMTSKYDFIPGEKVIFFEDFSDAAIGDFPLGWNTNTSGEIVNTSVEPGKWLRFSTTESIWTDELLKLPENYTAEFDVIPIEGEEGSDYVGYTFRLMKSINKDAVDWSGVPGEGGFALNYYYGLPNYRSYINDYNGEFWDISGRYEKEDITQKINNKYHIAIWVQKSRIRVYQDQTKVFDVIKAFPKPFNIDRIRFENGAALVGNIRIATGLPDMRSKLITEGKLVTYGIYFDVNKDVVKPESFGTLKEISKVLSENPDLKVKIVGHTDSDGDDKSNLDLSKRRAASVKDFLVKNFSIAENRIQTDGMGESQPVAPNDNATNKALNRRVEFIKL